MNSTIGAKIRMLRLSENMTQAELAEATGISPKSIQRFERNLSRPDVGNLIRLSTFFDVSADYLLGFYESQKTYIPMEEKALPNNLYREMYEDYILCKHQALNSAQKYHWIFSYTNKNGETMVGGQTQWAGWADNEMQQEIRQLCEVIPEKAIKLCRDVHVTPLILHNKKDVKVFLAYGGHALIEKNCCEQYLLDYIEPFLTNDEGAN